MHDADEEQLAKAARARFKGLLLAVKLFRNSISSRSAKTHSKNRKFNMPREGGS